MSLGGALLFAAVRHPALDEDRLEGIVERVNRTPSGEGPNPWEDLIILATEQGVLPQLYPAIGRWAPEVVRDHLRDAYATNVQRNARVSHTLGRVLDRLKRSGTDAVVLKGAALVSSGVYQDPGLRPMADVDILIPPADLRGAYDGLLRAGFTPLPDGVSEAHYFGETHQAPPLLDPETAIPVELHRRLFPRALGSPLRAKDVFYRSRLAQRVEWAPSIDFRIPSTEDMVLHLSLHTLSHSVFRLLGLVDLARLETSIERRGSAVAGLAGQAGVRGTVSAVVALAVGSCGKGRAKAQAITRDIDSEAAVRAVGDCAIPARLLRRRPHWIVDAPLARLHVEPVASMEAWVGGRGAGAVTGALLRAAFPSPPQLRQRPGARLPAEGISWPLLYPLRWCLLLWRFVIVAPLQRLGFGSDSRYADSTLSETKVEGHLHGE